MIHAVIAVMITIAIFGCIIAMAFSESSTWLGDTPNPAGCLLAFVALAALAAIGFMKLVAWLW